MKGDFLGFSFDGIHCSQLGITHVSSSDRYDEDLFPEVRDKTIEIPNNHGEYYYGSTYGTRTFEINIAYDSITEKQFRDIRRLFGTRKVCELIFDERPYKVYYAKIESPIEMSYVCFDEQKKTEDNSRDGIRRDREHDQEYMPGGQIIDSVVVLAGEELKFKLTRIPNDTPTLGETEVGSSYDSATYTYTFINNTENDIEVTITYNTNEIPYAPAWEQITPWKYEYDEGGRPIMQRIYKGEGTVNLICYQPFAHQLFKIKELYEEVGSGKGNTFTKYDNVDEWIESSGILTRAKQNEFQIDKVVNVTTTQSTEEQVTIPIIEIISTPITEEVEVPANGTVTFTLSHVPNGEITLSSEIQYEYDDSTYTYVFTNEGEESVTIQISYTYKTGEINTYEYELSFRPISEITITGIAEGQYTIEGSTIVFNRGNEEKTVTISYNRDNTELPYSFAIPVYNPGDLNVGFALYIPFVGDEILPKEGKSDIIINGDTEILVLTPIERKNKADTGILIDTRTHLIEGVSYSQIATMSDYRSPAWEKTGSLYNEHIKIGEFPYIKRNDWELDTETNRPQAIYISCGAEHTNIGIYYDYLYF